MDILVIGTGTVAFIVGMRNLDGELSRPISRHEKASGMVSSEPHSRPGNLHTGRTGSHPKQHPPAASVHHILLTFTLCYGLNVLHVRN